MNPANGRRCGRHGKRKNLNFSLCSFWGIGFPMPELYIVGQTEFLPRVPHKITQHKRFNNSSDDDDN